MRITHRTALLGVAAMLAVTVGGCASTTESSTAPSAASDGAAGPELTSAAPPTPGLEFYADPESPVLQWVGDNSSDERGEAIRTEIGEQPMARWFGAWSDPIGDATESFTSAAYAQAELPIMVAYNISGRDACGGHSGGGSGTPEAYGAWIEDYADGVADRPAVIVLEPDALGDYECMSEEQVIERQDMLISAIGEFSEQAPNAWVYLDGGTPDGWSPRRWPNASMRRAWRDCRTVLPVA